MRVLLKAEVIDPKVFYSQEIEIDITEQLVDQKAGILCDAGVDFLPRLNQLLDTAAKLHASAKAESSKQLELPLEPRQ